MLGSRRARAHMERPCRNRRVEGRLGCGLREAPRAVPSPHVADLVGTGGKRLDIGKVLLHVPVRARARSKMIVGLERQGVAERGRMATTSNSAQLREGSPVAAIRQAGAARQLLDFLQGGTTARRGASSLLPGEEECGEG